VKAGLFRSTSSFGRMAGSRAHAREPVNNELVAKEECDGL